jgi:hypothetical protein
MVLYYVVGTIDDSFRGGHFTFSKRFGHTPKEIDHLKELFREEFDHPDPGVVGMSGKRRVVITRVTLVTQPRSRRS